MRFTSSFVCLPFSGLEKFLTKFSDNNFCETSVPSVRLNAIPRQYNRLISKATRNLISRPGILLFYLYYRYPLTVPLQRDHWAKTQSPNRDVKVYLGAPGSADSAGNGFVSSQTLINVARDAQNRYSSFGGIMLWDADSAYSKQLTAYFHSFFLKHHTFIYSQQQVPCHCEKCYSRRIGYSK
jgi:hypothetical protein